MPENNHSQTETAPPHAQLVQMAHAHWVSHIVYVAAKLSLADHLATGPKSADEIAAKTGTHAPSLYRLMRTLANLGILTEDVAHSFALIVESSYAPAASSNFGRHGPRQRRKARSDWSRVARCMRASLSVVDCLQERKEHNR